MRKCRARVPFSSYPPPPDLGECLGVPCRVRPNMIRSVEGEDTMGVLLHHVSLVTTPSYSSGGGFASLQGLGRTGLLRAFHPC